MKNKKRLLESIPGIGDATINVVLFEFYSVEKFRNTKALAAYIGVALRIRQSGTSLRVRGMMSKMGRSKIKKSLLYATLVALRYNPVIIEKR